MYTLIINGRKRRRAELDAAGEPVVKFDQSPLKVTVSGEAAEAAEARFLVAEFRDAPDATIEIEGKPDSKQPLHDFLAKHRAVAPKPVVATLPPSHGVQAVPEPVAK